MTDTPQETKINLVPEGFEWNMAENKYTKGVPGEVEGSWSFGLENSTEQPDMKEVMWKGSLTIRMSNSSYVDVIARTFTVEPDTKDGNVTRGHLSSAIHEQMNLPLSGDERTKLKDVLIQDDGSGVGAPDGWLDKLEQDGPMAIADLCYEGNENVFGSLVKKAPTISYFWLHFN